MLVELVKSFEFEAAHATDWGGDTARLHGHSFRVDVLTAGACKPQLGWLVDYGELKTSFDPVFTALDHRYLNEIDRLEDATLKGLERWLDERLRDTVPYYRGVRASIRGEQVFAPRLRHPAPALGLGERIQFGFEAAHALPNVPAEHKCRRMHGHSFVVEVAAGSVLTLTPKLQDVYDRLDHRCLNDIAGLDNPTSEAISGWIWRELRETTGDLEAVVVAETCTARCIYRGE